MGRIHSYPYQWVLFIPESGDDFPDFDDDTLIIVCQDSDPMVGTKISYAEYEERMNDAASD